MGALAAVFTGGVLLGCAFSFVLFHLAVFLAKKVPGCVPCSPCAFPLGSLGNWDDLLALNRQMVAKNAGLILQWSVNLELCVCHRYGVHLELCEAIMGSVCMPVVGSSRAVPCHTPVHGNYHSYE